MFKIRASACGKIMTGTIGLTENQEIQLNTLIEKKKTKALTPKQEITKSELIEKKENKELPETVKTYCKDWSRSKLFNRRTEIKSKYIQKGHIMEDNAIDFIAEQLGYGMLFKNEERRENEFMTGECDIKLPYCIIDAKNSWSWETFPIFETEIPNMDYYWQGQGYMHLYDKKNYKLIYCLMDTPLHLIEKEAYSWCINNGYSELEMSVYDKFVAKMTYPDIPDHLKIKVFEFKRNEEHIAQIKERVEICRDYIETLENLIPKLTIDE